MRKPVTAPAWLRTCSTNDTGNVHPNGQLPGPELCALPLATKHLLHPDAAEAWWRLSRRYRARFARQLCVTDSYRSIEAQQQVYSAKPELAALPGTSNHGWGIALDLCGGAESYQSEEHQWLRINAPTLGWDNPEWAQKTGTRPEPWHWEYTDK